MLNLKSKIILITGCSSGFGYVTAKYLGEKGYTVIPTVRKKSDLTKLPNTGLLDVTWPQLKINRFIYSVIKKYGRIDVLINNAGYGHYSPLENITDLDAKKQFETNLIGPLKVTRAVLPFMKKQKGGLIVNVSSLLGLFVIPSLGIYSASKYALEAYSTAIRLEQQKNNIKVTIINPGRFTTSFGHQEKPTGSDPIHFARLVEKILDSDHPKDRYLVGKESIPIGILLSLPLFIREAIFKKIFSRV